MKACGAASIPCATSSRYLSCPGTQPCVSCAHPSGNRSRKAETRKPCTFALRDDQLVEPARPAPRPRGCTARSVRRGRSGAPRVEVAMDRVGDRAADVVEVDVDAVGAERLELRVVIVADLVVERGVEAELVDAGTPPSSSRRRRCRRRGSRADLGDLSDDHADRAGCAGDDDRLAGLRMADRRAGRSRPSAPACRGRRERWRSGRSRSSLRSRRPGRRRTPASRARPRRRLRPRRPDPPTRRRPHRAAGHDRSEADRVVNRRRGVDPAPHVGVEPTDRPSAPAPPLRPATQGGVGELEVEIRGNPNGWAARTIRRSTWSSGSGPARAPEGPGLAEAASPSAVTSSLPGARAPMRRSCPLAAARGRTTFPPVASSTPPTTTAATPAQTGTLTVPRP